MRALEDLLGAVKDQGSRQHLREATRAYDAGAFKSAIVSLWVAVAVDLVGKVRQLADLGEPAAAKHIADLDAAIAGRNKQKLMAIEGELLDRCRDEYELIDARDHDTLSRLRDDRHICAHPAFVSPDVVFEPTAELVRSHIATAVDAVLSHGPTPGRKAIDRFTTEIQGNAWPNKIEDLREYLRERYFSRGRDVLRRNLAQVIVKGCLAPHDDNVTVWKRLRKSALALDAIEPALLAEALNTVVRRAEENGGLDDLRIIRFIGALGELQPAWDAVPPTSVPRFVSLVRGVNVEVLTTWAVLSATTPVPDVERAIEERLGACDSEELASIIAVRPAAKHVPYALAQLAGSGFYRGAERHMEDLVLPLAKFIGPAQLEQIRATLASNSQVHMASGMPAMVEQLYEATKQTPGAAAVWAEIADDLDGAKRGLEPDDWFSYPQLRARVAADQPV